MFISKKLTGSSFSDGTSHSLSLIFKPYLATPKLTLFFQLLNVRLAIVCIPMPSSTYFLIDTIYFNILPLSKRTFFNKYKTLIFAISTIRFLPVGRPCLCLMNLPWNSPMEESMLNYTKSSSQFLKPVIHRGLVRSIAVRKAFITCFGFNELYNDSKSKVKGVKFFLTVFAISFMSSSQTRVSVKSFPRSRQKPLSSSLSQTH